jgi:hypothetical protein
VQGIWRIVLISQIKRLVPTHCNVYRYRPPAVAVDCVVGNILSCLVLKRALAAEVLTIFGGGRGSTLASLDQRTPKLEQTPKPRAHPRARRTSEIKKPPFSAGQSPSDAQILPTATSPHHAKKPPRQKFRSVHVASHRSWRSEELRAEGHRRKRSSCSSISYPRSALLYAAPTPSIWRRFSRIRTVW